MLVLASIATLFPQPPLVGPGKWEFSFAFASAVVVSLRMMISSRGVAKKRRGRELPARRVKSSLSVAGRQQSWRCGNHCHPDETPKCSQLNLSGHRGIAHPPYDAALLLPIRCDRKTLNRFRAESLAPFDLLLAHRQRQFRPAPEQGFQHAFAFDTRAAPPSPKAAQPITAFQGGCSEAIRP